MTMRHEGLWMFRESDRVSASEPITGYSVEASDGSIGKIDEATYDVGSSYVVIDTGPWIFGKKVMLPAGIITGVDHDDEAVFVSLTKDEIKGAPEFDHTTYRDDEYQGSLGKYYQSYYDRDTVRTR